VLARYRVTNASANRARGTLYLALRPFQVNPPAQFLNTPGGVSPIRTIRREGASVIVNGDRRVECVTVPGGFGASTYDGGNIVAALRRGTLPLEDRVTDPFGYASAALAYPIDLAAGNQRVVDLIVPLAPRAASGAAPTSRAMDAAADTARAAWRRTLDRVSIQLPDSAAEIARTLRAQIGYILVNRDGPAIQPGSRAYERSWIRDGALTCSALLRLGHADAHGTCPVQFDGRRAYSRRDLQRRGSGAHVLVGRRNSDGLHQHAHGRRAHPGRQVARTCRHR